MIKTAEKITGRLAENTVNEKKTKVSSALINIKLFLKPLACCIMACLMGRLSLIGGMSPAGIAFCWALVGKSTLFYPACLFSLLGYMSKSSDGFIQYTSSLFLLVILGFITERKIQSISSIKKAIFPAVCVLLGGIAYFFYSGQVYIIIKSVFESAFCAGLWFVFSKGVEMVEKGIKPPLLEKEQAIVLFITALIAASFTGAKIYIFDIHTVICVFAILAVGISFSGLAAAFGVMLGFILLLNGGADEAFFGMICLSSLMCGIFSRGNKTSALVSFALGGVMAAFYSGMVSNVAMAVSAVIGACIFLIMPDRLYAILKRLTESKAEDVSVYMQNAKDMFDTQSRNFASAFRSLAEAFEPEKELTTETPRKKNDAIIDDAADKVCRDCTMNVYCWNIKSCETLSGFYSLIGQYDKNGMADESALPEEFKVYCIKPKKLCDALNNSCRILKNNAAWYSRFVKSRSVISEQLYSVANIIDGMAKNTKIDDIPSSAEADEIKHHIISEGVPVESVYVFKEPSGRRIINIKRKKCTFESGDCTAVILPIVNSVCSGSFVKSSVKCAEGNDLCSVTLRQSDFFGFKYSVSAQKRYDSDVSGDSYLVEENENGVLTVAVSDGMGSGKAAKEESSQALKLLSKFSSSGFDAGLSAGILNSVLLGRGDGELFTTLDVCCINMYTGRGRLVKNGGSTAFIIRDGKVTSIRSTSLPIGILGSVDSDITEFNLKDGDILLMVTDGVIDFVGKDGDEGFIEKIVRKNRSSDISVLSKSVTDEAMKIQKGKCKDDMLCVCVKIFEKR